MTDAVWGEFQRTSVLISVGPTTLRVTPAAVARRGTYLPGTDGPLHILTAYNPQGLAAPLQANVAANLVLADELATLGLTVWPTTGVGEGGSWTEEGFTVAGLTRAEALAIALRFDQRAIFEWVNEPGGFRLVACDGSLVEDRGWQTAQL